MCESRECESKECLVLCSQSGRHSLYASSGDGVKIDPIEVLGFYVCPTVGHMSLLATKGTHPCDMEWRPRWMPRAVWVEGKSHDPEAMAIWLGLQGYFAHKTPPPP